MEQIILSSSARTTEQIAAKIGERLRGGECIELSSDLGGGKTTFTRGLVAGAGSADQVASPTFTVSKQYSAKQLTIYHYDFYRLQEPGLVAEELAESVDDKQAVTVIEWAQSVDHVLPSNRLQVTISRTATDENERTIQLVAPESLQYLVEGVA